MQSNEKIFFYHENTGGGVSTMSALAEGRKKNENRHPIRNSETQAERNGTKRFFSFSFSYLHVINVCLFHNLPDTFHHSIA
jgi:hypothetical protein